MKLIIQLELDNAAFDDREEVGRILEELSRRLPEPPSETTSNLNLHATNGDWVGKAWIE